MYLYDPIAYKWLRTITMKARKSAFITLLKSYFQRSACEITLFC